MKYILPLTVFILVSVIETTNAIEETEGDPYLSPLEDYETSNDLDNQKDTLDSSPLEKRIPEWNTVWTDKRAMEWKLRGGKRGTIWKLRGGKRGPEWKLRGGKRSPDWKLRGGKRSPDWKLRGGKRWGDEEGWSLPNDKNVFDWKLRDEKKRSWLGDKRAPGNWMLRGGKRAPLSWMLRGGKRSNGWVVDQDVLENQLAMTSRENNSPFIY
ncbi:uncharacterized protein [Lepeophtheirus salmonis]|nr:uncharacterized protein LOC121118680 [Lepeophtheirus salmonis]